MNKSLNQRKLATALTAASLVLGSLLVNPIVHAQTTEDKIELMSAALEARDSGDLQTAKAKLEQLLQQEPNNRNVQRMLAAVNQDIESGATYGQASQVTSYEPETAPVSQPTEGYYTEVGTSSPATTAQPVSQNTSPNVDALLAEAEAEQSQAVQMAETALADARALVAQGYLDEAKQTLADANAAIPETSANLAIREELSEERARIAWIEANEAIDAQDYAKAQAAIADYENIYGVNSARSKKLRERLEEAKSNPYLVAPEEVAPDFLKVQELVTELLRTARAQYLLGAYQEALDTYARVLAVAPNNTEAKVFQAKINAELVESGWWDYKNTREDMLREVSLSWKRPETFQAPNVVVADTGEVDPVLEKIRTIIIPRVRLQGVPLRQAAETLSELSAQILEMGTYPQLGDTNPVNINVIGNQNPNVQINLNNVSMQTVLDNMVRQVGYDYEINDGVVTLFPGAGAGGGPTVRTEFFPISRQAVIRMTGGGTGGGGGGGGGAAADPFADPFGGGGAATTGGGGGDTDETEEKIKSFLERAGVNFGTDEASIAYDGAELIVTNTDDNIEKTRNILRRYDETRQVEIEAKFLEVQQGALEELGFDWNINNGGNNVFGTYSNPSIVGLGATAPTGSTMRNIGSAFAIGSFGQGDGFLSIPRVNEVQVSNGNTTTTTTTPVGIDTTALPSNAPTYPNVLNTAADAIGIANVFSRFGNWNASMAIRALEQSTGSDLMTAPRITVLSGKTAQIVVAQEIRYPETYGDTEAEASTGDGDSSIAITAGTPQDFVTRRIGVEMEVTPTVENRDTISLRLEPKVTEFEGFVEFGGKSIAISSGTTVSVPSGFYQPIFSVREIRTEVTIFDGATVMMGGLTREEVKTVDDRVPVLGDIPLLGRLFQSKGETSQKRNLLIFVTANLVSPGGSPANQAVGPIQPGDTFQNPVLLTPGGPQTRGLTVEERNLLRESVGMSPETN